MAKKICFLVGSMAISGGTYVIVQHAAYLRGMGYDVTLAIQEPYTEETLDWHDKIKQLTCLPFEEAKAKRFDLVIATWWKTALELGNFYSDRFGYFVQSIESRFYPSAEKPLRMLVDSTYDFPINYVTEAKWIKDYLSANHCQTAALVRNGIRKDIYTASGESTSKKDPNKPRLLIEGPFGVSFKNTALSIRLAKEAGFDDIWLLTGSPVTWIPGVNKIFSRVPMTETPKIYRSCDILLKLSTVEGMFGPPLEIFHCGGTAIVFSVSGHDEYIIDKFNACVIPLGDVKGVVIKLKELLTNKGLRTRLQQGAMETAASWPDWEKSSAEFQEWVDKCLSGSTVANHKLAELADNFFSRYDVEERERLNRNPNIVFRYKLRATLTRFAPRLVKKLKKIQAILEVIFVGRRAI